jgi:hypothetical protein
MNDLKLKPKQKSSWRNILYFMKDYLPPSEDFRTKFDSIEVTPFSEKNETIILLMSR